MYFESIKTQRANTVGVWKQPIVKSSLRPRLHQQAKLPARSRFGEKHYRRDPCKRGVEKSLLP